MGELPSGTVTFLFTDLVGSTRLWNEHSEAMTTALARHDAILRGAIEGHAGHVVKTTGDGVHAVFTTAQDAVGAAVDAQRALVEEPWGSTGALQVRMGLHTGEAELRDGDYYGSAVNRAARLMSLAHGGQVVMSAATAELVRDSPVELVDLGEHHLRDLDHPERVSQLAHPALRREFPPLQSVDELPGNLPRPPNRFVGRSALVGHVAALVAESPVVTLTGPGGVGKTRLALQVAARLQPDLGDGAWFVDLAPVTTAVRVPAMLLETLGYTLAAGEDDVAGLCSRLRRRRLLLVIDNCEHLVASVANVVDAISAAAPEARVIATSREGLGIPAERVLPVAPLATDVDGDAVELFVVRARAVHPDFTLDDNTRGIVLELCRRLDGIPLAIELAAARTRSIAPAKILERLDERFRVLTGGSRTAVARHQTLQAAVDWSYDLLSEAERTVLDRLAVFPGGFTLDAAEAVAGDDQIDALDVLDHLSALVDKSLVVADAERETYRLLETIRQYAAAKLAASGAATGVRARHAAHYRSWALAVAPELVGPGDLAAFARIAADLENVRLMLDWYRDEGRGDAVVDVVWGLEPFWDREHSLEMIARLEPEVALLDGDHERLCRAHALLAHHKATVGYVGVPGHVTRSAEHAAAAGVPMPVRAEMALGTYYMTVEGDDDRAVEHTERAAAVARAIGDRYWAAYCQCISLWYRGLRSPGSEETLAYAENARREMEQVGSQVLRMLWLGGMGIALQPVDPAGALALLDEQAAVAERWGFSDQVYTADFFRGIMHFRARRYPESSRALRSALAGARDMGNRRGMCNVLSAVTGLIARSGSADTASVLLLGLHDARERFGLPGSAIEQEAEQTLRARLGGDLDPTRVGAGRAIDVDETVDLALDSLDEIATRGLT